MSKFDKELDRMRAMMNYGLKTEDKNQYKAVEYQRLGADGKMYGIVREGTKYYIKVSNDANSTLKESFDYIGGFRNRKDFEYESYANAAKHFDMKLNSIKESKRNLGEIITESVNLTENKGWTTETTEKMRGEIERQREIMNNAKKIFESKGKPYSTNVEMNLFESKINEAKKSCDKVDGECSKTQETNIKEESPKQGDATKVNGNPFTEEPKAEDMKLEESEQVLGWNDNKDYLDTSHGTEIGDGSPFNEEPHSESEMENGVIDEGAMHNTDNQNSPEVGTSEVGDSAPFEKKVTNELSESSYCEEDDVEMDTEEPMDDVEGEDGEMDFESDEEVSLDEPMGDDELEVDSDEDFSDDMESRISTIEDLLSKIADKLGIDSFEDDDLYDDESMDSFEGEDEEMDFEDDEDDYEVYESINYKKMMNKLNEDRLDYFGKHPAYQKEPMGLPSNNHQEKEGYYDMNDDSVKNDSAYGQSIGSGAPFEIDPQTIENSIAESIKRILKKKI